MIRVLLLFVVLAAILFLIGFALRKRYFAHRLKQKEAQRELHDQASLAYGESDLMDMEDHLAETQEMVAAKRRRRARRSQDSGDTGAVPVVLSDGDGGGGGGGE